MLHEFTLSVVNAWNAKIHDIKVELTSDGNKQKPDIPDNLTLAIGAAVGIQLKKYEGDDSYRFSFADANGNRWTTEGFQNIILTNTEGVALLTAQPNEARTFAQDGGHRTTTKLINAG
jgi:hypothetical protein